MWTPLPLEHDAESPPLGLAQSHQRGVHAGQLGRTSVGEDDQDGDEQGAHAELARTHAHG